MNSKKRTTAAVATLTLIGGVAAVGVLISNKASVKSVSAQTAPDVIRLTGSIRDFRNTHPDFETVPHAGYGHYAGNVRLQLDGDGRPAFAGNGINAGGGQYDDIDLIAYWPFDDGSGGTATDTEGLNHGTLMSGPAWTTGRYGSGLHFNGVDDYVEIPSSPEMQVTGDITFAGWFKLDDTFTPTSPDTMVIMEKILDVDHDFHIGLAGLDYNRPEVSKGALVFKVENGPDSDHYRYTWTNRTTWTAGEWYHFAAVLDSSDTSQNTLFINGVNDRSAIDAGGVGFIDTDYDAPMRIGGKTIDYNGFATDIYFEGTVDDVMIFDRIVTEADFVAGVDGGFKVATEWRDDANRPIAPHLYVDQTPGTVEPGEGIVLLTTVDIRNDAMIDSFDSSAGSYGPGNQGNDVVLSTNSTGSGDVDLRDSSVINGDVYVGPGGDPSTVIMSSGGTITGAQSTLDAAATVMTIDPPTNAGPDLGTQTYSTGTTVISSNMQTQHFQVIGDAVVQIADHVVLWVTGDFLVSDNARLEIMPGASLEVYFEDNFTISLFGQANMNTGDPSRMRVRSIAVKDVIVRDDAKMCAQVVSPSYTMNLLQNAEFFGTFFGEGLVMLENAQFHMDSFVAAPPVQDACANVIIDTAGTSGAADSGAITSSETYAEWYRDVLGTNLSAAHTITLTNDGTGTYEFFDDAFHPIDDRLLGNDGASHNALFTYAIESSFTYEACAGQFFAFQGADDAWLFIDGKLAMDLGGVVPGTSQHVSMDRLELVDGETYSFHFFYAQRHWASSMFRMRTNLPLDQDQAVMASGGFD